MRIRTIKPEWLSDEKIGRLSDSERVLSLGLILMADDHGRGRANPALIRSTVWPYADPPESLQKITEKLQNLLEIGFINLYSIDDQNYYEIRNWLKHQRISHPCAPTIPVPTESLQKVPESLQKITENFCGERKGRERKGKEEEGNAREREGSGIPEPTADEILDAPAEPLMTWKDKPFIWQRVVACWVDFTGAIVEPNRHKEAAESIAKLCLKASTPNPYKPLERAMRAWLSDPWVEKEKPNLDNLAKNFNRYVSAGKTQNVTVDFSEQNERIRNTP